MKKKGLIFPFFLLSLFAWFSFIFAEQRICNKEAVNVRSGPGTNYEVILTLKRGDIIEVTQERYDWIQFKLPNGSYGWVKKNLTDYYHPPSQTDNSSSSGALIFLLIVAGAIGLIVLISGLVTQCPSCNKWWARELIGSKLLNSEGFYKTITREDIQRNNKGEVKGRTQKQEQVHMIKETYENYYQCKYCKHTWSTISSREYEG